MSWFGDNGMLLGLAMLDGPCRMPPVFVVAVGSIWSSVDARAERRAWQSLCDRRLRGSVPEPLSDGSGHAAVISLPLLVVSSAIVGAILGPPIERLLRSMQGRRILQLLVTFALFMILEDLQKLVWGVQPVVSDTPVKVLGTVDVAFGADEFRSRPTSCTCYPAWRSRSSASPGSCVVRRRPNDRRRDGRPGGRAGNGDQRRKGHAPDVHGGRGACCVGGALASPTTSLIAGDRRLDHRAFVRRGRNRRARADRGCGYHRAHDWARPIARCLFCSRVRSSSALHHHGVGAVASSPRLFAVPETRRI